MTLMPLAHYYDVDREHSTKYTSSHEKSQSCRGVQERMLIKSGDQEK